MFIDYTLIAGLLLYFFVAQSLEKTKLSVLSASLIVVLGSFGLSTLIKAITLSDIDPFPVAHLFGLIPITTVVLQFLVGLLVFARLRRDEESYSAWLLWSVIGCIAIFLVVPSLVSTVLF